MKQHRNILFHVDHVQGIHKVPLSIEEAGIDLCTVSGHKFHYKRDRSAYRQKGTRLIPLITGGSQQKASVPERNTRQAPFPAKAINLSARDMNERLSSVEAAKNALMERLSGTDGVVINTPLKTARRISLIFRSGREGGSAAAYA